MSRSNVQNVVVGGAVAGGSAASAGSAAAGGASSRGKIYENQIQAVREILESYQGNHVRWVTLLAEMQSGKTTTYMLTAIEMIMNGTVDNVVILSGNTEISIRDQIKKDIKKIIKNYVKYVCASQSLKSSAKRRFKRFMKKSVKPKIKVLWGHALTKSHGVFNKTLFIWDESHAAQTKGMRPDKFLNAQNILANGNLDNLDTNDNYVLSVSATSFAELSNMAHNDNPKRLVKLENGHGYIGVKNMMEEQRIIPYYDLALCLQEVFSDFKKSPCSYGIIRSSHKNNDEMIRKYCERAGIQCIQYDSSAESVIKSITEFDRVMKTAPQTHCVIIVKGMLRMGKEVHKEHVNFCMETATNPKTDTVLQGLMGRMCGYHSYNNIKVYVHTKIYESGELDRYITMMSESRNVITCMPRKGANLLCGAYSKSDLNPIIPIRVDSVAHTLLEDGTLPDDSLSKKDRDEQYRTYIKDVFASDNIESKNTSEQNSEIKGKMASIEDSKLILKFITSSTNKIHICATRKIAESLRTNTPKKLGSSCGISADGSEIVVRIYKCDFPEFDIKSGDIYVDARTVAGGFHIKQAHKKIPKTTKKEVFYQRSTDADVVVETFHTSEQTVPQQTQIYVEYMRNSIIQLLDNNNASTLKIISNQPPLSKIKGFLVRKEVFNALEVDGAIYNYVKDHYNVSLNVVKKRGRQSAKYTGYVQFSEISFH
jgi:hypothetical protein